MKTLIALIFCFIFSTAFSQTDRNGNPVFNSEVIGEEEYGMNELMTMYYKIETNIDNKKSSVYMTDNPSLKDYIRFALTLPSYGFMVSYDHVVKYMVMVGPSKAGSVTIIVMDTKGQSVKQASINFKGTITESRANELIQIKADKDANISEADGGKKLIFDGGDYKIILLSDIKKEVFKILDELSGKKEIKNPVEYVKKESKNGGALDYDKKLDETKLYEFDDIIYSKPEAMVYLWARAAKKAGITSEEEAMKLWEEIYDKKLEDNMKKSFRAGFK